MIIVFSNFKGGVGKTSSTALFSYILTELKGKKVLAVDTDQQANLSKKLARTFNKSLDEDKTIYHALFTDADVKDTIQSLSENLDLLSGSWLMSNFESLSNNLFKEQYHNQIILQTLESVREDYDYILIDTSPDTDFIKDNSIVSSDYVFITACTIRDVFVSIQIVYNYLFDQYNSDEPHLELSDVRVFLLGENKYNVEILYAYEEVLEED